MTDLKFPANKKRKDKDFTVPLGDILSRSGRWNKEYQKEQKLEELKAKVELAFLLLLGLLALWLAATLFVDHAQAQVVAEQAKNQILLESCEQGV